jgi:hypothetical protein
MLAGLLCPAACQFQVDCPDRPDAPSGLVGPICAAGALIAFQHHESSARIFRIGPVSPSQAIGTLAVLMEVTAESIPASSMNAAASLADRRGGEMSRVKCIKKTLARPHAVI